MREPKYKRVLLKISGEALAGDAHRGLDFAVIGGVCDVIKQCVEAGVQVGVVVGGGNFWRGVKDGGGKMERTRADHMGMLATVINALAVADCLEQRGVEVRVQTAIAMNQIAEPYIRSKAIRPRTSTASTPPTRPRTPPPSNTTPSPMTRCSHVIWPSWTPRPHRFPWIIIFPFRSSRSRTRRTSCAS